MIVFLLLRTNLNIDTEETVLVHTGKFSADSLRTVFPEPEKVPGTAWWVLVRGDEVAIRPGRYPVVLVLGNPAKDNISLKDHMYSCRTGSISVIGVLFPAMPGYWILNRRHPKTGSLPGCVTSSL